MKSTRRAPRHAPLQSMIAPSFVVTLVLVTLYADSHADARGVPPRWTAQVEANPEGAPASVAQVCLEGGTSSFVPNLGQWEHPAHFVHRSGPMTLFFEDRGWVMKLEEPPRLADRGCARGAAVRMSFEGDARAPELVGERELPGVHNYFLGEDASRWRADVPLYASLLYKGLYPGIELRVRHARGHPEYDLLLEPGADLGRVSVRVDRAHRLRLDDDGALVIDTALGPVTQPVPRTWQGGPPGERRELPCRFVLRGANRFGFEVLAWDGTSPLTIDPGLIWSTFLGEGNGIEIVYGVSVDANGVVTVAGETNSATFPATLGAFMTRHAGPGNADAFVSQLDPGQRGSAQLVYSTFLGGTFHDSALALAVDADGVVTVAGRTSSDFPVTPGAYARTRGGFDDGFVARLDPRQMGTAQLAYSTYLAGRGADFPQALSVDARGVVTVVGRTSSSNFPTTSGAFDTSFNGFDDAFVSQLDPRQTGGAQLVYSTFLGGDNLTGAHDVAVDANGVLVVAGMTASPNFPTTTGAYDRTYNGILDAFVSLLDPSRTGRTQLVYSTFLGGGALDRAMAVTVDQGGIVTVAGTASAQFPVTTTAYDTASNGRTDGFVSRLIPAPIGRRGLVYSTYLGSSAADELFDLSVDRSGVVTVAGYTGSGDFPTTPGAYDRTFGGSVDVFVSRLDPVRSGAAQLLYSTFLGNSDDEYTRALAAGRNGAVTVAGETRSTRFPTTPGAYATTKRGTFYDVFVSRLAMLPVGASAYGTSSPGCNGPLTISVSSWPRLGNAAFSVTCDNAPPSGAGLLMLSARQTAIPVVVLGVSFWVDLTTTPFALVRAVSNPAGAADVALPIPSRPRLAGQSIHAQFLWVTPSVTTPCPPLGLSASNALAITFQP